ncbi:hypothetical protein [Polyangium sorediatum]|uniref:Uncharacterized protein n=1 Tax=Polyangium sorediatum TaxID=889274 RepID=A0ABT6P4D2_9BACT|nr:hypothetical protein [Polyangium sorediatum]MDI1435475.1 hypothetical protein [Polyangium sorediatum]
MRRKVRTERGRRQGRREGGGGGGLDADLRDVFQAFFEVREASPDVCDFFPAVEHGFPVVRGSSSEVAHLFPEVKNLSSEVAHLFPEVRNLSSEVVDFFPEVREHPKAYEGLWKERKHLLSEVDRPPTGDEVTSWGTFVSTSQGGRRFRWTLVFPPGALLRQGSYEALEARQAPSFGRLRSSDHAAP